MLLFSVLVFAQPRSVTGQVRDEQGNPIGFATITEVGRNNTTQADVNGNFSIRVANGAVLNITAVGISQTRVNVTGGQNVYAVTVQRSNTELTTVVVSALGVRRSVKSTPYVVQQVSAERLTQTRETDVTSALAGKVAGLQVLGQSGAKLGSTGSVRLRGAASVKDKYAIYVVDGTIVTNVTDINTDDIANISVLKGPNATALYGQRAEGGVIVVTTKKAGRSNKFNVSFAQTTTAEQVANLPRYQNLYGGGNSAAWKTFAYRQGVHPAEWAALDGKKYHNYSTDESWGPRIDGSDYIPWYAWYGGHADAYKTVPYTAQPDNIKDFFRTGLSVNNNIQVEKGGKNYSARFSVTNLNRTGIIPESKQTKNTFSTQLSFDIVKNLTVGTNTTYSIDNITGDFNDGYSNFTSGSFNQWFHRDLDMTKMKSLAGLKTPAGVYASWNHLDPSSTSYSAAGNFNKANYWYNPYTWLQQTKTTTDRNRLFGDASLKYKIMSNWDVTATYRYNYRTTKYQQKVPQVIEDGGGQTGVYSAYTHDNTRYFEQNIELVSTYRKSFNDLSLDLLAGANYLKYSQRDSNRTTNGGLVKADVYEIANSKTQPPTLSAAFGDKAVMSIFGRATLGYKDFLFGDFTLRQDWSSVLPATNNGYLTPSIGLSFVFSDFLRSSLPQLSYGKLRASFARIGTDELDPYEINPVYTTSNIAYNNQYTYTAVPNLQVDPNIKPTINSAYEAGLDLRFLKDRIGLSTTYFYEVKRDDIITTDISSTSGYTQRKFNVGEVIRKGVELQLDLRPVKARDFSWDLSANWSLIRSTVTKISPETKTVTLNAPGFVTTGLSFGNPASLVLPSVVHNEGQEWGQLRGYGIKKINGRPVLDASGLYVQETNVNFGGVLPNYTGGVFNQFNYKNFFLSATIDYQQGGKFFSLSDWFGTYTGLMERTAATNDNGKNVRDAVSEGGGVHVYGVSEDGKPVDFYVDGKTYFKQFSDNSSGIADLSVFDATFIKVREASLGYRFTFGTGAFVKTASVSLVARNPWLIYRANPTIDPSELSNRNGENGQLPGTRSLGLNVKLGF